jgi:hypothetical protein
LRHIWYPIWYPTVTRARGRRRPRNRLLTTAKVGPCRVRLRSVRDQKLSRTGATHRTVLSALLPSSGAQCSPFEQDSGHAAFPESSEFEPLLRHHISCRLTCTVRNRHNVWATTGPHPSRSPGLECVSADAIEAFGNLVKPAYGRNPRQASKTVAGSAARPVGRELPGSRTDRRAARHGRMLRREVPLHRRDGTLHPSLRLRHYGGKGTAVDRAALLGGGFEGSRFVTDRGSLADIITLATRGRLAEPSQDFDRSTSLGAKGAGVLGRERPLRSP